MKIGTISLLLLSGLTCFPGLASAAEQALRFGVIPYLTPARMDDIYSPVSRELSESLKQPVKFRTSTTLPRFRENLADADYDFAIIVPILYPYVVDQLDYIPLLRMQEQIHSMIVVPADSPLQTLSDLVGKTVGTPPVNGPVVLLAKQYIAEQGVAVDTAIDTAITFNPSKTVGGCMQRLLVRQVDACIVPNFAVATFEQNIGVKLRTLLRTEGIPSRALVVHSRVPQALRSRIRQTLLSWNDSDAGQALLRSIKTSGFIDVKDSEYDIVRKLLKVQED